MKPNEYYNYPKRRYRIWWLPLAAVLVLVVWTVLSKGGDEAPAATAGTESAQVGVRDAAYHTVLIGGELYSVLDGTYSGELDVQPIRFDADGAIPQDFLQQTTFDRADYEAFCESWSLRPAFPDHDGRYAVLARADSAAERAEVKVGDVRVEGQTATVLLWERFSEGGDSAAGFVLTVPVPSAVTELRIEPLYLQEEVDAIKRGGPTS